MRTVIATVLMLISVSSYAGPFGFTMGDRNICREPDGECYVKAPIKHKYFDEWVTINSTPNSGLCKIKVSNHETEKNYILQKQHFDETVAILKRNYGLSDENKVGGSKIVLWNKDSNATLPRDLVSVSIIFIGSSSIHLTYTSTETCNKELERLKNGPF